MMSTIANDGNDDSAHSTSQPMVFPHAATTTKTARAYTKNTAGVHPGVHACALISEDDALALDALTPLPTRCRRVMIILFQCH